MLDNVSNFQIDPISFFIGLAIGVVFGFLLTHIRAVFPQIAAFLKSRITVIRAQLTAGVEQYLRQVTLKRAQRNHLAFKLFSIDEVVIPPRFLPHLNFGDPANLSYDTNITSQAVTFLPGWADQASQYPYPSFSLSELLSGNANVFIVGQPGTGKSVALAHFASQLARKDPSISPLAAFIPLYLHIHELDLPDKITDPLDIFIRSISRQLPKVIQSRLPGFISSMAREGKLIILLDGLDELYAEPFTFACLLIKTLLEKYPVVKIVTTAPSYSWDQLVTCGLIPVSIARWNFDERARFITQWSQAWQDKISPLLKRRKSTAVEDLDFRLATSWISPEPVHLSPMEWVLKIWAFFSNDTIGNTGINILETYIRRMTGENLPQIALANLAVGFVTSKTGVLSIQETEDILSKFTYSPDPAQINNQDDQKKFQKKKKTEKRVSSANRVISGLISQGFLKEVRPGIVSTQHPLLMGYLASLSISGNPPTDLRLSKRLFLYDDLLLHYLVAQNVGLDLVSQLIRLDEPPFHESLICLLSWLKDAPLNTEWRTEILKQTVQALHDPATPEITKQTLVSCLAISNDPGVAVLFRQLLSSPLELVRRIVSLGCGSIQDYKAIPDLSRLLDDPSTDVRISSILSIGIIQSPVSLKASLAILSEGEEVLRQAASETLAHRGPDGQQVLKNALTSQNLLLRRAVVYGLSEIKQQWAEKLLEKIAVEDGQWVVRNAASHALENLQRRSPFIPVPLPLPSESSWLIAFASRQGIGIIPGKPVNDLLLKALELGTPEERLASLTYIGRLKGSDILRSVYVTATSDSGIVKEYAYLIYWYLSAAAVPIQSG
jgi:hypothetical protein